MCKQTSKARLERIDEAEEYIGDVLDSGLEQRMEEVEISETSICEVNASTTESLSTQPEGASRVPKKISA